MTNQQELAKIIDVLNRGGVIAYPTEAVFGLGCDPFNEIAVRHILKLKHRSITKGLIVIASAWEQISELTKPIPDNLLNFAKKTWPGPVTWVFPASPKAPYWLTGEHTSIALRITNHPTAKSICDAYKNPIVSTSANIEGNKPATTAKEVLEYFPNEIDFMIDENVGALCKPTIIRDALTGKILRN